MKDNTKVAMLLILKNVLTMICFTILAIIFKKWWIVFFSIIFISEKITVYGIKK